MSILRDRLAAARLRRPRHPSRRARLLGVAARLWRQIETWHQRARQREELARLTMRDLRDLGITPSEALREVMKPFWRA